MQVQLCPRKLHMSCKFLPHHIHEDNQDGKFTAYATASVREGNFIMCYGICHFSSVLTTRKQLC